ncbi:ribosome maturation factor RimM [Falseniella ignava]|uniref:Ribosome maturation factor RimM n=2 Tax=Falseniella ignava TaxID=137730 RepID=K1LLX8_9LACT|nr:ribosome maturation factor RimM [Falseniella ignava]EKB57760.1 16S rRNA processing protein RimM [Falseniella ignava CCUG 37419]PKY90422.1 ribosome maturation factor RimM [Falseniella ignava]
MTYYKIGRLVNTFGIRGEVKVIVDSDFPEERLAQGATLYILKDDQPIAVTVQSARQHKGSYIVAFEEYQDINQVECYKGSWLAIEASQQQALEEDHYYYHQIEGLKVYTVGGEHLGQIKEILALGSNDVWVVKPAQAGRRDILLPYIGDVVKEVDLTNQRVTVELMEGLIDDAN